MSNCGCCPCESSAKYPLLLVPQILSGINLALSFFAGPAYTFYIGCGLMPLHMIQCCFVNKIMVSILAVLSLCLAPACYWEAWYLTNELGDFAYIFAPAINYVVGTIWLIIAICELYYVKQTSNGNKSVEEGDVAVEDEEEVPQSKPTIDVTQPWFKKN